MPDWEEAVVVTDWRRDEDGWRCLLQPLDEIEEGDAANYLACVTGLRDYVDKNGFPGVVLGLSGGIDSALCAAMAVDALGPRRVHGVMLPYAFTSNESLNDAAATAEALGDPLRHHADLPGGRGPQREPRGDCRIAAARPTPPRRTCSRAPAARCSWGSPTNTAPMVVTTGNKSEVSVGYATLYGDMNGGFNPIKDLYKTQVYALARYRNSERPKGCLGPEGRRHPRERHHQGADGGAEARASATRTRCRLTTCSTMSSIAWSSSSCRWPRSWRGGMRRRR